MKTIGITYLMSNKESTAETYIELPICEEGIEQCTNGMKCGIYYMQLVSAIRSISRLQGYTFLEIETVEII